MGWWNWHERDQCFLFSFEQHKNFNWGPGALGGSFPLIYRASTGFWVGLSASWLAHHRQKESFWTCSWEVEALQGCNLGYSCSFPVIRAMCSRRATCPTARSKPCSTLPGPAPSRHPPAPVNCSWAWGRLGVKLWTAPWRIGTVATKHFPS